MGYPKFIKDRMPEEEIENVKEIIPNEGILERVEICVTGIPVEIELPIVSIKPPSQKRGRPKKGASNGSPNQTL